jgi:hypothetical protein
MNSKYVPFFLILFLLIPLGIAYVSNSNVITPSNGVTYYRYIPFNYSVAVTNETNQRVGYNISIYGSNGAFNSTAKLFNIPLISSSGYTELNNSYDNNQATYAHNTSSTCMSPEYVTFTFGSRYVRDVQYKVHGSTNSGSGHTWAVGYTNDLGTYNWVTQVSGAIFDSEGNISVNASLSTFGLKVFKSGGSGCVDNYDVYEVKIYADNNYYLYDSFSSSMIPGSYIAHVDSFDNSTGVNKSGSNTTFILGGNSEAVFRLIDSNNNTNLSGFSVLVYNSSYSNVTYTNGFNLSVYGLQGGFYYYNISKGGYNTISGNFTFAYLYGTQYINGSTNTVPSVTIRAYQQANPVVAISNFSVELYSNEVSYHVSGNTTNGVYFKDGLPIANVIAVVSSPGYASTQYVANILNSQTSYTLNAYLILNSSATSYTFYVKDDRDQALSGALVSLDYISLGGQRYNYYNSLTDISGAVVVNVNEDNTYYITVSYSGLLPKSDVIHPNTDSKSYTIHLSRAISTTYQQYAGSNYYLSVVPSTSNYSANTVTTFTATAYSTNNTLNGIKVSMKLPQGATSCIVGVWDGQNCTLSAVGSPTSASATLQVNTGGMSVLNFNILTNVSGFSPDLVVKPFYVNTQDVNRSVFGSAKTGFKNTGYNEWIIFLVLIIICLVVALSLTSYGLPNIVGTLVGVGLLVAGSFIIMSNPYIKIFSTLLAVMLVIMMLREGA